MPRAQMLNYPYHPFFPVKKQYVQRHRHKKRMYRITAGKNHGIHCIRKLSADHSPQPYMPAQSRYRIPGQTMCRIRMINHDTKQYTFLHKKANLFRFFNGKR